MTKLLTATGVLILALAALVSISSNVYAQGPGDEDPDDGQVGPVGEVDVSSVLDLDYDDLWTEDFPQTIGGYKVGYINTPKNRACISTPIIYVQTDKPSLDEFLAYPPDMSSLNAAVQAVPGIPSKVSLSFSPTLTDEEVAAKEDEIWNREVLEDGCLPALEDFQIGNNTQRDRGFAIFQNKDAGRYTDDNGQGVKIRTPSRIGTGQDEWSAALNNTKTNTGYFLQSGMILREDRTRIVWGESHSGLQAETFKGVPYLADTLYQFSNSYGSSVWWMCAGNDENISGYECILSAHATGTHLKEDQNTGAFFENANTVTTWNSGFPDEIEISSAVTFRDGIGHPWSSEDRWTVHACGSGQYPVSGAMSGTLKNHGIATWIMSGIPIACP